MTTDRFDKGMAFAAGLAMYNWGLRVSEAAKTLSDKAYRDAGEHWEKSIDQHASRAEDFVLGVQGVRSLRSGMVWMSAFEWSQLDSQRRDQLSHMRWV